MKQLGVDCVSHNYTAPEILIASGIHPDGTIDNPNQFGIPNPTLLIFLPGDAQRKLNAIRVAMSQWSKTHNVPRTYEIKVHMVCSSFFVWNGNRLKADYVLLTFPPGSKMMQANNAYKTIIGRNQL